MSKSSSQLAQLRKDYQRLRRSLAQIGYISQGSVVDRSKLRPPRSGFQWTRKVKGKTITVALSESEFLALAEAIANERKLNQTIRQMEQISRRILFLNRSQTTQRKPLRQKVLGLI
ncbi:MAG TPA: DUF6788 family protein [Candidatus Angelobacter sp.]|jgi:hypothetical protein|nr:DUF6788 family protein [Candidatus Angelobacter sp.]